MKKISLSLIACSVFCSSLFAQAKKNPQKSDKSSNTKTVEMKNAIDSFSYAAGINIGNNMKQQGISEINSALMSKAIEDVLNNKTTSLTPEQASMTLQEKLQAFAKKKSAAQKEKGEAFCMTNKARKEVTTLSNGLQYEILKAGDPNGIKPTAQDTVVVHYVGTLIDGTEFDNSLKRGEPATFPVGGVIKGWTQILQLMTKGAQWKVVIPSDLAYGERGAGAQIPPGSVLVFEINLIDIKPAVK